MFPDTLAVEGEALATGGCCPESETAMAMKNKLDTTDTRTTDMDTLLVPLCPDAEQNRNGVGRHFARGNDARPHFGFRQCSSEIVASVAMSASGSTLASPRRTAQCRCGPVTRPV